ncbi:MAG: two-component histidine kinase [uncultured bacterium]|nr:MAG: two-component histidine kinase [uncultured bacterium]
MIPLTKISGGGMITRRLILAFFLIPFLLGLLQYIAHEAGIWTRPILQALTLYLAISFFLVLTWITARKIDNLEEDLKRSIINLKQLERLREEWISIVAHDLRQPINVIGMAANILNDLKDKVTKDEAETIRIISTNALKLNRLINDLLNASQIEARRLSIERRKTDLVSLLKKTVTLFEKQVPERQISLQTPKETPCLAHIDPDRIEQVLDNLFSNAVKYSDQATPIEITLTHLPNEFQIAVSNHGKEIDKDQIPNIFTRFYRAPGSSLLANGIGLGLYIAKGLVEAHGGKIWVQSIPGNTTFTFALPI